MNYKYIKVLFYSIASWVIYFGIVNWTRLNIFLKSHQHSNPSKTLGVFLMINIVKYFLLLFGIISLVFLIIQFFKKEK